jgi:hypothetical protein
MHEGSILARFRHEAVNRGVPGTGILLGLEKAAADRVTVQWPDERPDDWMEWEAIIRDTTRHWTAPGDVTFERHGNSWRVAAVALHTEPRQPVKDNQWRHRVTEALRARGKPAGLGA